MKRNLSEGDKGMRVFFYLRGSGECGELRGFEEFHFKVLLTQPAIQTQF